MNRLLKTIIFMLWAAVIGQLSAADPGIPESLTPDEAHALFTQSQMKEHSEPPLSGEETPDDDSISMFEEDPCCPDHAQIPPNHCVGAATEVVHHFHPQAYLDALLRPSERRA